ncbi:hypothetical protein SLE2022_288640 [Rubroshorea leprosula]
MGERTLTFRGKPRKPINSLSPTLPQPNGVASPSSLIVTGNGIVGAVKGKKKPGGARLWMRFDKDGKSEVMELEKRTIIKHARILSRDLRILSLLFSQPSNILGRFDSLILLLFGFVCFPYLYFFVSQKLNSFENGS